MCVQQATWASAAKVTSTSVCPTHVTREAPTTAFSSPTATAASAAPDTQVLMAILQQQEHNNTVASLCANVDMFFFFFVVQVSVVTRCLTAVKDDPAGMEEHVL